MRRELLQYLLTLDVLEEERAEEISNKLIGGEIENTAYNRKMATPQFKLVSREQLVAIEFYWGLLADGSHAFDAMSVWYDIRVLGRRFNIPALPTIKKTKTPLARHIDLTELPTVNSHLGLRDLQNEISNKAYGGFSTYKDKGDIKKSIRYTAAESLSICDKTLDDLFFWFIHQNGWSNAQHFDIAEGVKLLLSRGVVLIRKGSIGRYEAMAKRGQYLFLLKHEYNLDNEMLSNLITENSISHQDHRNLCQVEDTPDNSLLAMSHTIALNPVQLSIFASGH